MTYRTTFLFIPRNGIQGPILRDLFVSSFGHSENEPFLGGFAPPATWANHRSVFNGIRFILIKTCAHKDTARYALSNSKPFKLLPKGLVLLVAINLRSRSILDTNKKSTREYKSHYHKSKSNLSCLSSAFCFLYRFVSL